MKPVDSRTSRRSFVNWVSVKVWDRRLQQMPTPQARPSTVHNFRVVSTSNFVGDPSGLVKPVVEGSTSANAIQFAHIEKRADGFWVVPTEQTSGHPDKTTYLLLEKNKQEAMYSGMRFKFAREDFVVKELVIGNEVDSSYKSDSAEVQPEQLEDCYICKDTTCSEEDPFVAPCGCTGDTKHIHFKCLKQWVYSAEKLNINRLRCRICNQLYKTSFVIKMHPTAPAKRYNLFDPPFVTFQSSASEDLYAIFGQTDPIVRVGRSRRNDIRLTDSSVSRFHSEIVYNEEGFFLRDLGSTRGTFISVDQPMHLIPRKTCVFRIGGYRVALCPKTSFKQLLVDKFSSRRTRKDKMATRVSPTPDGYEDYYENIDENEAFENEAFENEEFGNEEFGNEDDHPLMRSARASPLHLMEPREDYVDDDSFNGSDFEDLHSH